MPRRIQRSGRMCRGPFPESRGVALIGGGFAVVPEGPERLGQSAGANRVTVTATDNHGGTLVHDPAASVAWFGQAPAGLFPAASPGDPHDLLTPLSASAYPLLVAHPV